MSSQHPVRDAGLAVSLLTLVPTRSLWPTGERTQVAAWFPAVGVVFGLVGYATIKAAEVLHVAGRAPYLIAALVVVAWAFLSRLLHWDGLADVADGFWGSYDRQSRLEIMSDSHTGAFGATTVALTAVLEIESIGAIIADPHELPVLLVPVVSRFSATAAAWLGTPARQGGLGRSVTGHPTTLALVIGLVPLAGAMTGMWLGFHVAGLALGVFGLFLAFAVPHALSQRFGGVTGDVMGASVLLTETILFVAFVLAV